MLREDSSRLNKFSVSLFLKGRETKLLQHTPVGYGAGSYTGSVSVFTPYKMKKRDYITICALGYVPHTVSYRSPMGRQIVVVLQRDLSFLDE